MNTITILLSLFLALIASTQAQQLSPGMPATVYLTPYKNSNCTMSDDISSLDEPSAFAVTTGRCYNSTYTFISYAQATNFEPTIPCALTIFSGTGCTGETLPGPRFSKCFQCITDLLGPAQSFRLNCGP